MDPPRPPPNGNREATTRAEKFEDEKRRIIDSCFSRTDPDGSLQETYITHIRIVEFATHPSTPPPPEAQTRQNEKARVIIVSVKKSGRVRMHKSKENANGTFSIGKTWTLDDLSQIESFTGPQVPPDRAAHATSAGFTVTVGKPYFWRAQADKEKRFFIASLVKIYGKYTGGRHPNLVGFEQRELDQVSGASSSSRRNQAPQQTPPPIRTPQGVNDLAQRNVSVSSTSSAPRGPYSRGTAASATSPNAIPPDFQSALPPAFPQASPLRQAQSGGGPGVTSSPVGSIASSRGANTSFDSSRVSQTPRDPSLRRLASNNRSQESVANSFATTTSRDDGSSVMQPQSNRRNGAMGMTSRDVFPDSTESPQRPKGKDDKPPPERRRPPMDPARPQNGADRDLVPAPLMAGPKQREPSVPPRSGERSSPQKPMNDGGMSLGSELGFFKERMAAPSPAPTPKPRPANRLASLSISTAPSPSSTPKPPGSPNLPDTPTRPEEKRASKPPPKLTLAGVLRKAVEVARANGGEMPGQEPPAEPPAPSPKSPADTLSPVVDDESRPGLGSMIKKKSGGDIAASFWKAATVAGVFKPRPGGAMDQIRKGQSKSDGPDGITSVVPAPPKEDPNPVPDVKVTVPDGSRPDSVPPKTEEEPLKEEEAGRAFITGNDEKYLQTLGVDSTILDKRGKEFAHWLDYFHWVPGESMQDLNFDDMKIDVEKETNKIQAGGWVTGFQEGDVRVEAIKEGLDTAIGECDELDNLLTLYSVELATLQDDIAYIEAQGQGLQVQAANQKTLQQELQSLLETCAISAEDLEALRFAPLDFTAGVEEIETSLVVLYKAMHKIDPTAGGTDVAPVPPGGTADPAAEFDSDYGKMRIVQEKKAMYTEESSTFLKRLIEFLGRQIDQAHKETMRAMHDALSKKADPHSHDAGRDMLWKYSPILLYARDIDLDAWNRALQVYQDRSHPVYKTEFREAVDAWKRYARKMNGEEAELLFTTQHEKQEHGGLATTARTARKLTVKRSQNLARSLRGSDAGIKNSGEKTDNRSLPYEVFSGIVDDLLPMVEMEQNFIIDMFHATSQEQADFPDLVAACGPRDRRGGDLKRHRLMEPDRELARRVTRAMETVFAFLEHDLQGLIDWVLSQDPLQGVGVLATLERKHHEIAQTNQDFLNSALGKLHANLVGRFGRFVDEQVRGIEETKVKINKRRGVINFVRVFPSFSASVENMLSQAGGGDGTPQNTQAPGARKIVDAAYDRIVKTMFDSLKVIARENPGASSAGLGGGSGIGHLHVPGGGGNADPDDKESLNYNILLIENMHHFVEETDVRNLPVLEEWRDAAARELGDHLGLYLNAVMRRPLGRLLEFLENVEAQAGGKGFIQGGAGGGSTGRGAFNKVMGTLDAREVRKGIEALRKRVEKHFTNDDDVPSAAPGGAAGAAGAAEGREKGHHHLHLHLHSSGTGGSGSLSAQGGMAPAGMGAQGGGSRVLVNKVFREAERYYGDVEGRIGRVTTEVYGGDVLFEWPRAEVKGAFQAVGR